MTSTVSTSTPAINTQSHQPASALTELLGAVRIFSLAVEQLVETKVQQEIAGDRLSRSQWKLLEIFALSEVRNVTDLATYQGVSTAAASKAADRLVRLGLLTREGDREDRRHICLRLSAEGERITRAYRAATENRVDRIFAGTEGQHARRLARELDTLTSTIKANRGELEQLCLQCALNRRDPCILTERLGATCNFALHHRRATMIDSEPAGRA